MSHDTSDNPRQRRTADERRVDVIQAAIAEFSKLGLHGGSTETIAATAGISQPYVLRLFGTKKALYLASVEHVCGIILDAWQQELSRFLRLNPEASPSEQLEAIGNVYSSLVQSVVELRLVLQAFASAEDDDVRALTHQQLDNLFSWVQDATGADLAMTQRFFASGMLMTIAASIRAIDVVPTQAWARAYLEPTL
ncbi:MAG: TetR/AcrR family transcriptional regulator [Thermomicrobiales bacterium]